MQSNFRRELRVSIELLSLAIMFLMFSIILLSHYFDKSDTINLNLYNIFNINLRIPYSYYVSLGLSVIAVCISLGFLIFTFSPALAERFYGWLENLRTRPSSFMFRFYFFIIFAALTITTLDGIASASYKLPDANWRSTAWLVGVIVYIIGAIKILSIRKPKHSISPNTSTTPTTLQNKAP